MVLQCVLFHCMIVYTLEEEFLGRELSNNEKFMVETLKFKGISFLFIL